MKRIVKFVVGLVIGVLLVPSWLTIKTFAQNIPDVVINELAWAGSSASWQDEWIELKNTTNDSIDLTGWQITKYSSVEDELQENLMLTIGGGNDFVRNTVIPPNGYFLISNYDKDHNKTVLDILPDIVDNRVSLLNDKLQLKLYPSSWKESELVDIAGNREEPLAGYNDSTKASMVRNLPPEDGTLEESWSTAEESQNLKKESQDLATPENSKRVIAHLLAEPQTGSAPLSVTFNASETIDLSGGDSLTFEWDFESEEDNFSVDDTTLIPTNEYIYGNAGSWLAGLKVTNSADLDDIIWLSIETTEELANQPPSASFIATPLIGTIPLTVLFNAEESSDDEDITEYHWDFGDGEVGEGTEIEHTFDEVGNFIVELTVKDGEGLLDSKQLTITAQAPEYSEDIIISELYPRPSEGSNAEFIELYNQGEEDINLKGWQLDDIENGGSAPHTIASETIILSSNYLSFTKEQTKISLNDSGDLARLIAPNSEEKDQTPNYGKAPRGQSYSLINDKWLWTETPTPNSVNVLTEAKPEPVDELEPEPEPDDTPEPDQTDSSTPEFEPGDIIICELLPNPSEGDEFIELYNPSDKDIDLSQWQLKDASGKTHTINDFQLTIQSSNSSVVEPDQYVIIVQSVSNIYLNNSGGESLVLLDPSGNEIDAVTYPDKALKDVAYVLMDDGGWTWANPPTPGAPNIIVLEDEDEPIVAAPVLPTLPPSGPDSRIWWGILLVSFAGTAIVFWIWAYGSAFSLEGKASPRVRDHRVGDWPGERIKEFTCPVRNLENGLTDR